MLKFIDILVINLFYEVRTGKAKEKEEY